ncbi:CaiB/BaiF CoA-transferase family protein [Henriciella sp.]|uniref:CaiB/BaiF CoA transferase family protein n=1 Tax=Henriciella sp. TaxID=1968823 RepID=UPI0026020C52|nr:CaiB/BaiF CoA-transferase family protein [Henriciella sp.]
MARALENIRILDLSRVLAGPWATQLLGDLGAEIIKVERPEGGDDTRSWSPPYQEGEEPGTREASYFLSANRNKKSICIDISSPAGQKVVRDLAASSDVLVENFKTGSLAKYGLDANSLRRINPRLVYCSITGFGQTGPYASLPGYDLLIQAMGGLMSITGVPDGQPGAGPMKVGVALVDILTGLYAANAIQAALLHRTNTGEGQAIDVSLLDCLVAAMANQSQGYLATGKNPTRMGNAHPSICPYDVYETADGHVVLAVGNDRQFQKLCDCIGLSGLADDSRFSTNAARVANRDVLTAILHEKLISQPTRHWLDLLENSDVPAGPVNKIADVFADPHVQARNTEITLDHAGLGKVPGVACPVRLSETPATHQSAAPLLGEHTDDVLQTVLNYCPNEVTRLNAERIISTAHKKSDE